MLIQAFLLAFATYSRLPVPHADWSSQNRRYVLCFFPLVGIIIALILTLWLWFCDSFTLSPFVRGAVGAVLPLLITGGIHMDGFMDTMDALSSWQSREKRLQILHDSHIGAFAAMYCAAYLLVLSSILFSYPFEEAAGLFGCFLLSRTMSASMTAILPNVRPDGMLGNFTETASKKAILASSLFYCILSFCLFFSLGFLPFLFCLLISVVLVIFFFHMSTSQFGGITGDLAGWLSQMAEILILLSITIAISLTS